MVEAICTACGVSFYRDQEWKKICLRCWRESKQHTKTTAADRLAGLRRHLAIQPPPGAWVDAELLKRIRMLVHPDRHGGSQLATEVTAYLNRLLEKARA